MDTILNAIKCSICREILESPVILPCNDIVCKKHVSNQTNDIIQCEKCGVEHVIPANGFLPVHSLEKIIKSGIGQMNFGRVHKEAKKSCESFKNHLKEFEVILKDPYFFTHEKISELKNTVQLKGEQLMLIIEKEMKKLIDTIEEYEIESKEYLLTNEFNVESKKLENELKAAQLNLNSWLESLNK